MWQTLERSIKSQRFQLYILGIISLSHIFVVFLVYIYIYIYIFFFFFFFLGVEKPFPFKVRPSVVTTDNYIGAITHSQSKTHNQPRPQSTKEAKVQTIISLDPLARNKVINKDIYTLEHLKYGGKSHSSFIRSWLLDFSPTVENPKDEISHAH